MRRFMLLTALCAALVLALTPAVMAQTTDQFDCGDFEFQEDAQDVFNQDPSDPSGLDEDDGPDDGIACENLPSRGGSDTPNTRITPDGLQYSDLPDAIPGDTGTGTTQGDLDCADFASQAEAQATFDADPSDPNGLDADNDGIACEETFSAPPTQATQQYGQPDTEAVDEETSNTTTTTPLPDTGGLPLVPLAGASLLLLGVAGLAVRRRVS